MKLKDVKRKLNLISRTNNDKLRLKLLNEIIKSIPNITTVVPKGTILFRTNKLARGEKCPSEVNRISYPPIDKVNVELGRCNKANTAVFYTSLNPAAAFLESNLVAGEIFIFSKWRVEKDFTYIPFGYTLEEILHFHIDKSEVKKWIEYQGDVFDRIHKTFNKWFTFEGNNYYPVTSLIADIIMTDLVHVTDEKGNRIDLYNHLSILYKSIAYNKKVQIQKADNLASPTSIVDNSVIVPVEAAFCRVDSVENNTLNYFTYDVTVSISNGKFNWFKPDTINKSDIKETSNNSNIINA